MRQIAAVDPIMKSTNAQNKKERSKSETSWNREEDLNLILSTVKLCAENRGVQELAAQHAELYNIALSAQFYITVIDPSKVP